jgi:hypothetical protein
MRTVAFLVLAAALAAGGCSKKTAKNNAPADKPAPQPQPAERGKADKTRADDKKPDGEKPNWLTDPRFANTDKDGKGAKDGGPTLPVDPVSPTGKPSWNLTPPEGGWTPPNAAPPAGANPMPPAQPPAGAPPAVQPQPPPAKVPQPQAGPAAPPVQPLAPNNAGPLGAAQRIVAMNDMRELWLTIENASGASGAMPGPDAIYKALVEVKSPAAELVKNGTISLTGTRSRESVWAYETAALTQGGLVVTQNGVEKLTAAELTQRLSGK